MASEEKPSKAGESKQWSGITRDMTMFGLGALCGWFGNMAYLNHTNALRTPAEQEAAIRAMEAGAKKAA